MEFTLLRMMMMMVNDDDDDDNNENQDRMREIVELGREGNVMEEME